jgi:hypothetical protein
VIDDVNMKLVNTHRVPQMTLKLGKSNFVRSSHTTISSIHNLLNSCLNIIYLHFKLELFLSNSFNYLYLNSNCLVLICNLRLEKHNKFKACFRSVAVKRSDVESSMHKNSSLFFGEQVSPGII